MDKQRWWVTNIIRYSSNLCSVESSAGQNERGNEKEKFISLLRSLGGKVHGKYSGCVIHVTISQDFMLERIRVLDLLNMFVTYGVTSRERWSVSKLRTLWWVRWFQKRYDTDQGQWCGTIFKGNETRKVQGHVSSRHGRFLETTHESLRNEKASQVHWHVSHDEACVDW